MNIWMHSKTIKRNYLLTHKVEPQMCTNLSSQTLSYTMTLIVTYTQPYKRFFRVVNFFYSPRYTLPIIHLVYPPNFWGITFIQRCTRKCEMVNHSFIIIILKNFVVWCTVFFEALSEILYNTVDTDRAKCFMLSCWTPLLLGTENEGVILPLLWWSSIAVINNGSDTG